MRLIHKIQYLSFFICGIAIIGCSSTENQDPVVIGTPVAAKATVQTNISDTLDTFAANTVIGIFMESSLPALSAANVPYYTAEGGKKAIFLPVTANQTLYYPLNNDPVSFIAYAPYSAEATTGYIPVNLSVQEPLSDLDLLYAERITGKSSKDPDVWFPFRHRLSKLHFNLYAGEGFSSDDLYGTIVKVKGISTRASFSLTENKLTDRSTPTDSIHTQANERLTVDMIVLPVDLASGIEFTFTLKGQTLHYVVPAGQSYLPGKQYNYTAKINNGTDPGPDTELSIEVACSISDWKNEDREVEL